MPRRLALIATLAAQGRSWGASPPCSPPAEIPRREGIIGSAEKLPARVVLVDGTGEVAFFHDRGYSVGALRALAAQLVALGGPAAAPPLCDAVGGGP